MKVRFWCSTHDLISKVEDTMELPDDMTDEELEKEAEQFFWERKEPSWGFERL